MTLSRNEDAGLGYPGGTNPRALELFGQKPLAAPSERKVEIGFPETPSAFEPQSYE